MIQIDPFQRPQVLLLGNGLNRTFGGNSWTDLMKQISVRSDLPETLTCPYPLQAVLVTNDHVKRAMEDYRNEFFGTVNGELQKQLQALLKVAFDDILTTNYSYEIEAAAVSRERPTETFLKKTCRNVEDGKRAEPKYLLHTCQCIPFDAHENRIWHIHGEARKPNSMILGHYYYASLLHEMVEYSQKRGNAYQRHQEENTMHTIRSWIDSFILGDVYILGFGMNFSEFDMWWLLNRKKREKAQHGRVYFYEPGCGGFSEKEELLKLLDVEVIHCGIPNLQGSNAEKDRQFRLFYQYAIEDIQKKTPKARNAVEEMNYV